VSFVVAFFRQHIYECEPWVVQSLEKFIVSDFGIFAHLTEPK